MTRKGNATKGMLSLPLIHGQLSGPQRPIYIKMDRRFTPASMKVMEALKNKSSPLVSELQRRRNDKYPVELDGN